MLKICTWNINGIRSFSKPFKPHLDKLDADIICLQETKAGRDLIANYSRVDGYNAYFAHCKLKPGYSGVCIFCREPIRPIRAYDSLFELLSNRENYADFDNSLDSEGRTIIVQFKTNFDNKLLSIISVYCPCADPENSDRVEFKGRFLQLLRLTIHKLIENGSYVVLAGDLNICHKPIDHCCPKDYMNLQRGPIEWLDSLILGEGSLPMVDIFRFAHPNRQEAFTCWNTKTGARKTNYGTRIDYILFDKSLACLFPAIDGSIADIMADIEGSDHCPVWALLPLNLSASETSQLPPLCSHFWPQCQKRQLNLSVFLKNQDEIENKEVGGRAVAKAFVSDATESKRVRQKRLDFAVKPHTATSNSTELSVLQNEDEKVVYCETALEAEIERRKSTAQAWQNLLNGNRSKKTKSVPLCSGHGEPCVLRCVKRLDSQHRGREFWACARPIGAPHNPLARCNTFIWK